MLEGVANRSVVIGEAKATSIAIGLENCDVVSPLIATKKKSSRRVEAETAWIVSSCPFIGDERQIAVRTNRENSDAIVQSVACIDKISVV